MLDAHHKPAMNKCFDSTAPVNNNNNSDDDNKKVLPVNVHDNDLIVTKLAAEQSQRV